MTTRLTLAAPMICESTGTSSWHIVADHNICAPPPPEQWQGRKAGHSPPTSAEVKKMWIYTSTLPYVFMA
jgi:hypothetical protein